jgi:putative phosphoribosyl transferase
VIQTAAQSLVDRRAAGHLLAEHLHSYAGTDALVVGITRGGLLVAHEVARRLHLPLEVLVVHRLCEPGESHLGLGAVTEHGHLVVSRHRLRALALTSGWLREAAAQATAQACQRAMALRKERERRDLAGRVVILVDDSAATGATLRAAVRAVRGLGAREVVVAVPVAPLRVLRVLRHAADQVVCPTTPAELVFLGVHYPAPLDLAETTLGALLDQESLPPDDFGRDAPA